MDKTSEKDVANFSKYILGGTALIGVIGALLEHDRRGILFANDAEIFAISDIGLSDNSASYAIIRLNDRYGPNTSRRATRTIGPRRRPAGSSPGIADDNTGFAAGAGAPSGNTDQSGLPVGNDTPSFAQVPVIGGGGGDNNPAFGIVPIGEIPGPIGGILIPAPAVTPPVIPTPGVPDPVIPPGPVPPVVIVTPVVVPPVVVPPVPVPPAPPPETVVPAIPEPSSWLLMILGIGFLGGALRVQNRKRPALISI